MFQFQTRFFWSHMILSHRLTQVHLLIGLLWTRCTPFEQGCHTGCPEAFWRAYRAGRRASGQVGGPIHYALYEPGGVVWTEKLLFQIYFTTVTFLTVARRHGHVALWRLAVWGGCIRKCAGAHLTLQIYHGRSVNDHLTLIGRERRSIGRIGRIGRVGSPPHRQPYIRVWSLIKVVVAIPAKISISV
jgi:hypothetical protein